MVPSNPEAARLYSEALSQLRVFENVAASDLLQRSVDLEPDFALGHAMLADAWSALGSETAALTSAQKALSLSSLLPEDERLQIEGRYYELKHDWAGAIGAYRHVWQDFPDDLESGLKLAAALSSSGNVNEALATISRLRSLKPTPPRPQEARIDLAEALITAENGNYKREQILAEEAARKARDSGARLLLARALLAQGDALSRQSALPESAQAFSAAHQIFQSASDRDANALALLGLARVLQKQGDTSAAREKLEQARNYFQQVGDNAGLNGTLAALRELSRGQRQLVQEALPSVDR